MSLNDPDLYLLVVAHPDDESMFFGPSLNAFLQYQRKKQLEHDGSYDGATETGDSSQNKVPSIHILSLSNGDYDGLGQTRQIEIVSAARSLGLIGTNNEFGGSNDMNTVETLDRQEMKDGPNAVWDTTVVADAILDHIGDLVFKQRRTQSVSHASDGDDDSTTGYKIAIVTFDARGVSGHPNHLDVHRGVRHLLEKGSRHRKNGVDIGIQGWELLTISNPLLKYCPLLEWVAMTIAYMVAMVLGWFDRDIPSSVPQDSNETSKGVSLDFLMFRPNLVWNAMAAHRSQFVWYRRLSVLFSRYTYANRLREIRTTKINPKDPNIICKKQS
eukprot:scaffold788_cov56-Attheya_sp.AAC.2